MQTWQSKLLYNANLQLGEGPHWHPLWKKFLYVDIDGKKVGRFDLQKSSPEEIYIGKKVGCVVPAAEDKLIVALQDEIASLDFATGELKTISPIEAEKDFTRCNDGKCDAAGRLWIGSMHIEGIGEHGALYCFDGSLLKTKIDKRKVSNGICWSKDNKTMYYVDSFDYNVKAYDFDLATGEISNERTIITITEPGHSPDGMTIDDEGMLWVAIWGGFCVNRYNPNTGELIGTVQVPVPHVSSCAFGGEEMNTLFITTAKAGLSEQQLKEYPLSGSFFIADTGCKGLPVAVYSC